jgi:peptide methionine sulfoxide reductase msrA/msrB
MKTKILFFAFFCVTFIACSQNEKTNLTKNTNIMYNNLTTEEKRVIIGKGTEIPFTGKYYKLEQKGTYLCKQCNAPLYSSVDKFDAHCGWPSFDNELPNGVKRKLDVDGHRTEILCAKCDAHLGHVFEGEMLTEKNVRHCVNSISMNFVPVLINPQQNVQRAIFAAGCFWGVEYYFQKQKGVISTEVGYIGGKTENPTYQDVCSHSTGHAEAIEVYFNADEVSFETLAKLFFEIHDQSQVDRQGPDVGDQYRTEIFYLNDFQKDISQKLIDTLISKGYKVATKLTPPTEFYPAESYHQDYYKHKGAMPYCHFRTKKF